MILGAAKRFFTLSMGLAFWIWQPIHSSIQSLLAPAVFIYPRPFTSCVANKCLDRRLNSSFQLYSRPMRPIPNHNSLRGRSQFTSWPVGSILNHNSQRGWFILSPWPARPALHTSSIVPWGGSFIISSFGHGMTKGSLKLFSIFAVASSWGRGGKLGLLLYCTWTFPTSSTNYSALSGTPEAIYKTKGQCNLHKT